jgi:hypothetical protein
VSEGGDPFAESTFSGRLLNNGRVVSGHAAQTHNVRPVDSFPLSNLNLQPGRYHLEERE